MTLAMHTISDYSETPGKVTYNLSYSFVRTNQRNTIQVVFETKEQGMLYYLNSLAEYVRWLMGDLYAYVHEIKPHYFDRKEAPFMYFDGGWRANYWEYRAMIIYLERHWNECGEYAALIQEKRLVIERLVSDHPDLKQSEMKSLVESILDAASQTLKTINKLNALKS